MPANQLTTITNLYQYLLPAGTTIPTADQALLLNLIQRASQLALGFMGCDTLGFATRTETYDGLGNTTMFLKNFPVLKVNSLQIGVVSPLVPAAPVPLITSPLPGQLAGYFLEPWNGIPPGKAQRITLSGYMFYRSKASVVVNYNTGYVQQNEPYTIAGPDESYTPLAPYGFCSGDVMVTDAITGAVFTPVASNPGTGQYIPPNPFALPAVNKYVFAAVDIGRSVLISYSYVPAAVEGAVINAVSEQYAYKDRTGQRSKSYQQGETVSYMITDLTPQTKAALKPYAALPLLF